MVYEIIIKYTLCKAWWQQKLKSTIYDSQKAFFRPISSNRDALYELKSEVCGRIVNSSHRPTKYEKITKICQNQHPS